MNKADQDDKAATDEREKARQWTKGILDVVGTAVFWVLALAFIYFAVMRFFVLN